MAELPYAGLERRLLAGGVTARRARRLVGELQAHYVDLLAARSEAGLSAEAAARVALECLGDEDLLARRILAQPRLLSWSRRWPWAVYGAGPLLLYPLALAAMCALIVLVGVACRPLASTAPHRLLQVLESLRLFSLYAPPALLTAILWVTAGRRGVAGGWIALSVALLAGFGSVTNVDVTLHSVGAGIGVNLHWAVLVRLLLRRCLPNALAGGLLAALWWGASRTRQQAVSPGA